MVLPESEDVLKLTFEHYGVTSSIAIDRDDLTIEELRDELLIPLIRSAGWADENINELFFGDEAVIVTEAELKALKEMRNRVGIKPSTDEE